jgi:hypothetical protein
MAGQQRQRSSSLVQNQKQVIAATWKLLKQRKGMTTDRFERDVEIVAASQQEIMHRTQMSLRRLEERFSFSDKSYDTAVTHLRQAVEHMKSAAEKLFSRKLADALDPEQAALQAILKAESESRTTLIQIARNFGGAYGGGRDQNERWDLRDLFEMEMGRMENRYELPRQAGVNPHRTQQDDTLEKLRQLARRQERLNRRQRDVANLQDRMDKENRRRRLEELRRDQEELIRQAETLSKQLSQRSRLMDSRKRAHHMQQLDQARRQMREAARSLLKQNPEAAAERGDKVVENLRIPVQAANPNRKDSDSSLLNALNGNTRQRMETEERIQQAAVDAGDLRRELEKLQKQVQALRLANRKMQQPNRQTDQQIGEATERGDHLSAARKRLQGIRNYAEGLLQPWASGEHWAGNARSIHRSLTRKEIEDFLNQPDLWEQLLAPVRELEATLRKQAELSRAEKKLFLSQDEEIPDPYRQPLNEYYRTLSETTRRR